MTAPQGECVKAAIGGTRCRQRMRARSFSTVTRVLPERELAKRARQDFGSAPKPFHYDRPMATSVEPVTILRGAHVDVDGRRVARGLITAFVVALAAVTIVLFAAAIHKNSQITSLRRHGVPIEVTVLRCSATLGGSGSNGGGYRCAGTFVLDGKRYRHTIPGDTLLAPGTTVRMITVKSDPGLITTVHQSEHTSWGPLILPTVLLVVLATLVAIIAVRSRRRREKETVRSASSTPLESGRVGEEPATTGIAKAVCSACSNAEGILMTTQQRWIASGCGAAGTPGPDTRLPPSQTALRSPSSEG
jgi:hypothetical protein